MSSLSQKMLLSPSRQPQEPSEPPKPPKPTAAGSAPEALARETKPMQDRPQLPPSGTELTKVSIYLDEPTDAFLEMVRGTARTAEPRVDATRSAVVRLALKRLAEQLRPDEVVAQLHRSASIHRGPGRKRA